MKLLLKRSGLLFIIIGVIILAISELSNIESNSLLIVSAGLVVGGLFVYLVINSFIE